MIAPWGKVEVNMIGPWKIKIKNQSFTFNALTCINPVTNLIELIRIWNKPTSHMAQQFENCWLLRYSSLNRYVYDNGGEFTGKAFQQMLVKQYLNTGTTPKNPQSNKICERIHLTVAGILRGIMRTTKVESGE